MSRHQAAVRLAEAGWSALLDRILAGLVHDLNGRVASIGALRHLAELGDEQPDAMEHELQRLETVARLASMLPADLTGPASPFSVGELLGRVLALLAPGHHVEPGEVRLEVDEAAPPVLVNEGRCLRGLLLYVDWAFRSTTGRPLVVEVVGDPDSVRVACGLGEDEVDREALEALAAVFALDGGMAGMEAGHRAVVELPSLAKARASLS